MPEITPYYTDVSGIFNIQQNLIGNLAPLSGNANVDSTISNISQKLSALYANFADSTADGVLTRQQDMINILNKEQARLTLKKAEIDDAYVGKQRAVQLNESYRMKYHQFMKIMLVVIVTLVLFIFVTFLSSRFPIVPSFIFEMLSILIISVGLFAIYFLVIGMLRRNNAHYDQLNLSPPPGAGGNVIISAPPAPNLQDLLSGLNINQCIGSSCCADGTRWDGGNASCVGNSRSGFTTIQIAQNNGDFYGRPLVKANSPNEDEHYTKI